MGLHFLNCYLLSNSFIMKEYFTHLYKHLRIYMYKSPKRELSPDAILGGFLIPDNRAEYIFIYNLLHHLLANNSSLMPCDWTDRLVRPIGECLIMHEVLLILSVSDIAGTWKVFTDSIRTSWCEITGIFLSSRTDYSPFSLLYLNISADEFSCECTSERYYIIMNALTGRNDLVSHPYLTRQERYNILKDSKRIYEGSPLSQGMCYSLNRGIISCPKACTGRGLPLNGLNINNYFPEFNNDRYGDIKNSDSFWWSVSDKSSRLRAFDDLLSLYKASEY